MTDLPGRAEEPAAPSLFQRWVDRARPRVQLWRTIVGVVIVVAVWAIWTIAVVLVASLSGVIQADALLAAIGQEARSLVSYWPSAIAWMVVLASFLGIWFGVWIAAAALHRRSLGSVISAGGGSRLSEFSLGVVIGGVYLAVGLALSILTGHPPDRTDVTLEEWALGFAPLCLFVFFQSAGEELFFRGYLVQQLAARFRSPIVWGFLPAVLFGLAHFANVADPLYATYYVAATVMFGLIATATVWRTGSLATAIGIHVVNNISAITLAGPATSIETQFWVWPDIDVVGGAPLDLLLLSLMLLYVLSPWAPFPKRQPSPRRNEMRAAP